MSSDRPQVRECWSVLANQAQEKVTRIQSEINQIREHIQSLEASHARVRDMVNDYLNPAKGQQVMMGMQEMHDARQFATQMTELMNRIQNDIVKSKQVLENTQARRIKADQERLKMEALMEQDRQSVAAYHRKKEQAILDATGLMQFNLGANA